MKVELNDMDTAVLVSMMAQAPETAADVLVGECVRAVLGLSVLRQAGVRFVTPDGVQHELGAIGELAQKCAKEILSGGGGSDGVLH